MSGPGLVAGRFDSTNVLEADHWLFSAGDNPDIDSILDAAPTMSAPLVNFLGEFSAESLISGLQHKKIHPSVLYHINLLIDQLLSSLITHAASINPKNLRAEGVSGVFTSGSAHQSTGIRALARECTGEAEMELRSYYDYASEGKAKGFPPGVQGRGMTASKEASNAPFPVAEAIDLMRSRLSDLSGMSTNTPDQARHETAALEKWVKAGGDPTDWTVEAAASWLHAFVEHLLHELLTQLGRVVERDSGSVFCGPGDLYTALAEDERYWGWFARLEVKASLEQAMKAMSKPVKHINPPSGRLTPLAGSPNQSRASLGDGSSPAKRSIGADSPGRASADTARGSSSVSRKTSTMSKRFGVGHERKDSNLSVATNKQIDDRAKSPVDEEEDEFDALVRSGATMKVSLTPSRLKTFDSGPGRAGPSNAPPVPYNPAATPIRGSALRQAAPSSGSKLAPRPATTIDERTDEEDDKGGRPKQSLKDLLASEPGEFANSPPGKRAVPAVILGAPPPGSALGPDVTSPPQQARQSSFRTPTGTSVNRDQPSTGREPLASRRADTDDTMARRKARSEAQELADFFNTTPPPPPPPAAQPAASTKSAKGFRGFVSKVTGSNKKKEEEARVARENALFEIPTAPAGPKKQRSMASFATSGAPPSAFRGEDGPPLPQKLRKRSDTGGAAGESDQAGIVVHHASSSTSKPSPPLSRSSSERPLGVTSTVEAGRFSNRPPPAPVAQHQPKASEMVSPIVPVRPRQTADVPPPPIAPPAPASQIPLGPAVSTGSLSALPAGSRPAHQDRSPSEANSFQTANEGDDGEVDMPVPAQVDAAHSETAETASSAPGAGASAVPAESTHSKSASLPTILISRLTPFRTLLQHATSAEECRMLVNAYCTQIGIPLDINAGQQAEVNAEAKVHAWLLDHESGPPVAWPWSPPVSHANLSPGRVAEENEEDATPRVQPVATFGPPLAEDKTSEVGEDAEELLSEDASVASLADEDEGLPPSVATAATRTSPVRVSPVRSLA